MSVSFPSVERTMNRWKRSVQPPIPTSLVEYVGLATSLRWGGLYTSYAEGKEFVYDVTNLGSVVMYSPIFCQKMENVEELNIDATFKVVPPSLHLGRSGQLLTLMGVKYNHVCIGFLPYKIYVKLYTTVISGIAFYLGINAKSYKRGIQ